MKVIHQLSHFGTVLIAIGLSGFVGAVFSNLISPGEEVLPSFIYDNSFLFSLILIGGVSEILFALIFFIVSKRHEDSLKKNGERVD